MKKWIAMLLAVAALFAATALAEAQAVTLRVDEERVVVSVGKTAAVKATVEPAQARKAGLLYAVSDERVATVDGRGRVRGVAEGACELTITSKLDATASLTIPVTVVIPVKKLTAEMDGGVLYVGESAKISVGFTPENATLQQAAYASSRESVATVDENGVVTGVTRGQATITVRAADGGVKTSVRVKVLQKPESIELTGSGKPLAVGKRMTLRATVLPKNADDKRLIWTSSNENVATVDKSGRVTAVAPGDAIITATSVADPSVSASLEVRQVRLAKAVAFGANPYRVIIGQTAQLNVSVSPDDTTDPSVTYQSNRPKIVSVDENGVVTALAPGKATITATTSDGSRRRARTTVEVLVPVTGVHFAKNDIRVGVNYHGTFTAILEPKEATNRNMTWTSDDESVAVVSGTTNRVRVSGRRWGRCRITGVTEDGGYTCGVYVDVGSLRHAVTVRSVTIKNGRPYLVLTNRSNMNITNVSFKLTGTDEKGNPIIMSTRDGATLYGEYAVGLEPGASTHHGAFTFFHPSNYPNLQFLSIAIIGWHSDTGYYGGDGLLYYDYSISESNLEWTTYQTDLYTWTQKNT